MSNYTLTTDLIADCMALIPENLERLNKNKNNLLIKYSPDELLDLESPNLFSFHNGVLPFVQFRELAVDRKYTVISHCLRTIPEFQEPNYPNDNLSLIEIAKKHGFEFNKVTESKAFQIWRKKGEKLYLIFPCVGTQRVKLTNFYKDNIKVLEKFTKKPYVDNVASATLHGQGEYPPSTLEELCESYKYVMSK